MSTSSLGEGEVRTVFRRGVFGDGDDCERGRDQERSVGRNHTGAVLVDTVHRDSVWNVERVEFFFFFVFFIIIIEFFEQ